MLELYECIVLGKLVSNRWGSNGERIPLVKCWLERGTTKLPLNAERRRVCQHIADRFQSATLELFRERSGTSVKIAILVDSVAEASAVAGEEIELVCAMGR